MSRFVINANEVMHVASMLTENNNQFRARVEDLMNTAQELASMWQGEANNSFNAALATDQERWAAFAALVDTHVETLREIVRHYQNAEAENVEIATRRTY